jgi:hypothetical protein
LKNNQSTLRLFHTSIGHNRNRAILFNDKNSFGVIYCKRANGYSGFGDLVLIFGAVILFGFGLIFGTGGSDLGLIFGTGGSSGLGFTAGIWG